MSWQTRPFNIKLTSFCTANKVLAIAQFFIGRLKTFDLMPEHVTLCHYLLKQLSRVKVPLNHHM